MRSNNAFLTTSLFLSLTAGCGLIKVNGKPLGGGSSGGGDSSSSSSSSSSASTASASDSSRSDKPYPCEGLLGNEYRECESREAKRYNDALDAPNKEARGKLPTWCKDYHISEDQNIELRAFDDHFGPQRDVKNDSIAYAEAMCAIRGKGIELKPKVMEMRAKWMKHHGLDELDFVTAVGLAKRESWGAQGWETLGPAVAQMKNASPLELDKAGAKASMLGSFEWVRQCLGGLQEDNDGPPLSKLLCVVEPLDVAKADAEIEAAPKINQEMRFVFRQRVRKLMKEQTRFKSALVALQKEEPAVGKLLAIAEKERAEWTKPSPPRAKLIAQLEAMEQATVSNKRSAFNGCEAPTMASWSEIVRSRDLPAVDRKDTRDSMRRAVFTTAEAYLAYRAFYLCVAGVSADGRSDDRIGSSVVRRGWRTSTIAAWFAASGQIKFDSRGLDMGMVIGNAGRESRTLADAEPGTIEKLTPAGTNVVIHFKQVIEEYEECTDWVPTSQISRINSNGTVSYVNRCTKTGMVKHDRTPQSVEVEALFAEGLKPGMRLYADGAPIVATANGKSSKPVWLFGVSLK